jgi:hypothetical protein
MRFWPDSEFDGVAVNGGRESGVCRGRLSRAWICRDSRLGLHIDQFSHQSVRIARRVEKPPFLGTAEAQLTCVGHPHLGSEGHFLTCGGLPHLRRQGFIANDISCCTSIEESMLDREPIRQDKLRDLPICHVLLEGYIIHQQGGASDATCNSVNSSGGGRWRMQRFIAVVVVAGLRVVLLSVEIDGEPALVGASGHNGGDGTISNATPVASSAPAVRTSTVWMCLMACTSTSSVSGLFREGMSSFSLNSRRLDA